MSKDAFLIDIVYTYCSVFDLSTLTTRNQLNSMYCKTSRVDTHDIKLTHSVLFDLVPLNTHDIPFMYYDAFLASFDTHDMKPMQTMCKLLYAVFDLSTLTT